MRKRGEGALQHGVALGVAGGQVLPGEVADEVGLGKTLVARGIIAKTLEHLQDEVERVDVIYICSNAAIATQNVNRLNVSDTDGFSIATRLTYLPRQVRSLRKNKVLPQILSVPNTLNQLLK